MDNVFLEEYQALAVAVIMSAIKDMNCPVGRPNWKLNRRLAREYLEGELDSQAPLPLRTALDILGLPYSLRYRFRDFTADDFRDILSRCKQF